ncbi:NAD(P)/FAD-dependent oxidoreductase [Bradyrhizobium nanningense]|uniref:NAD(P)/FAD-dependent oxidoreductase n=1 Tax=Bradyrhizobium nanningense TaxID=1325118 RepID=UPI0010091895|nr:FAD-dependent oxidoreductase [Bradyrhizobium nanningense]
MTNVNNHYADKIVVAGGAWSKELLAPLDVSVPLETERGYHAMLAGASIDLKMPFIHRSRAIAVTPMSEGLRVAGTVEIAGLQAAPDERRARVLGIHVRQLFPHVTFDEPRLWMGHCPSLPDSLPVLGPVPKHAGLYLCFGHGHFGMTGSPPSGRLVAEMVVSKPTFIDPKPYSIARF